MTFLGIRWTRPYPPLAGCAQEQGRNVTSSSDKSPQERARKLHARRERLVQLGFFGICYAPVYFALTYLKKDFAPQAIPWADAFASATAYTGMWLMAKKKVESWHWWIATNFSSIPLYFVKHYVFTSVYYVILLMMAVSGLLEWSKKAKQTRYAA